MSGVKGSKNVMPYAGGLKIEINPDKYSQAFELVDIIGHRPLSQENHRIPVFLLIITQ